MELTLKQRAYIEEQLANYEEELQEKAQDWIYDQVMQRKELIEEKSGLKIGKAGVKKMTAEVEEEAQIMIDAELAKAKEELEEQLSQEQ